MQGSAQESLSSRLSNRVLYGALILLTLAGLAVIAYRYAAELDHSKRLLREDLRARSVSLDQSFHVVQTAAAALAAEIGRRPFDVDPMDARDLLRMAYGARGTSDIAGFLYVRARRSACAPEGTAECGQWLAEAQQERRADSPAEPQWTAPHPASPGEWVVANLVPVAAGRPESWVAAEVRLSSLRKYTIPVHTVDSVVSLLDDRGRLVVDGEGVQAVGTPSRLMPVEGTLDQWVGKVSEFGENYVAADRVAGPAWFMVAKVPTATLAGEAATATSTLAIVVLAMLALLWSGTGIVEYRVLRPARNAGRKLAETMTNLEAAKSEVEKAYSDLQQAQAQLVEAEKLAALGGLVAGVAHEINTPIGVAMSAATSLAEMTRQFLKDLGQGSIRRSALERYVATMSEAVNLVERNLGRASNLITHFKQVAIDRTSCQRRSFRLHDVVTETIGTLYPAFKRTNFKVEVDIADGIMMEGYPGPLGQIITNLVTNSLVHAFEGRETGTIRVSGRSDGRDVILSCRDDGMGMNASVIKRMFEPFYTTKRGRGGSGLGMHIVYSLVTGLMGGEVFVESAPGEGTDIRMRLPVSAPESSDAEATARAGESEGASHDR